MDLPTLGLAVGLGFVLGLEHALDADHVVAVAALTSRADGRRRAMRMGIAWGLGHTLTLAVVGGILIGLQLSLPARLAWFFEFGVGIMLIVLGASVCRRAFLEWRHRHKHVHGEVTHTHAHNHAAGIDHAHAHASLRRPFAIGIVHGLAGSAALMLLVLSTLDTWLAGILYILAFGIGSIGAMAIISALLGLSFSTLFTRASVARWRIGAVAGSLSIFMGAFLIASLLA